MSVRDTGSGAAATAQAPLVLRVLSGPQSQVETTLAPGSALIGNDESHCDIVVDLGVPGRHSAYLRIEGTRLTLVCISGDAWVGSRHLEAHTSMNLLQGEVFTLGRVSMAIAPAGFDFAALALPGALRKPGDRPELAAVALPARTPAALRAAAAFRAALFGTCALSLTAALVWGSGAVSAQRDAAAQVGSEGLKSLQAQLRQLPGHELTVRLEGVEQQLVVEGFVPDVADHAELERTLQRGARPALLRVHPVAPLQQSLERLFAEVPADAQLAYRGDGAFEIATTSRDFDVLREAGERALKNLPGLKTLHIVLGDVRVSGSGEPERLTLARSATRAGQIVATGPTQPWPPLRPEAPRFVEVRWGELPSVLTRDGERLFAGARLADGGQISRIERHAVIVSRAGAERAEPVGTAGLAQEAAGVGAALPPAAAPNPTVAPRALGPEALPALTALTQAGSHRP
jgi:hypothetical protein